MYCAVWRNKMRICIMSYYICTMPQIYKSYTYLICIVHVIKYLLFRVGRIVPIKNNRWLNSRRLWVNF
jgi:hypothetical protein